MFILNEGRHASNQFLGFVAAGGDGSAPRSRSGAAVRCELNADTGRRVVVSVRRRSDITQPQRELILHRSVHLNESDRRFLKQLLVDGRTYRDLASANVRPRNTSCAAQQLSNSARVLHRRFLRLATLLLSPECSRLLSTHQDLCTARARICRMRFIQGYSFRQISMALDMPTQAVQRICEHFSARVADGLAAASVARK